MRVSLFRFFMLISLLAVFFRPGEAMAAGTWTSVGPWGGSVYGIAVDPNNTSTLYAATYGCGVFKSTDGAQSWSQSGLSDYNVSAILSDPATSGILYVATVKNAVNAVYRSTDGGATWTNFSTGLSKPVKALAVSADDASVLYARTLSDGVYKKTGSGSWTAVNTGFQTWDIRTLAVAPSDANIIYASSPSSYLYKSTDAAASWSIVSGGPPDGAVHDLAVDPANPNIVYAWAGLSLFKTTNGGTSWTELSPGFQALSLSIYPGDSSILYAGTASGVYKSTNAGTSWIAANSGITSARIESIAVYPLDSNNIYAASKSEGVFKSTNGGTSWSSANDNLWCWDMRALASNSSNGNIYAGDFAGGVFKTTDSGISWTRLTSSPTTGVITLTMDSTNSILYAGTLYGIQKSANGGSSWSSVSGIPAVSIKAITVDPVNPNILFVGTNGMGVYKSGNGGTSWVRPNAGISATFIINDFAIPPSNNSIVYTATHTDGVYKSVDGGTIWSAKKTGLTDLNIDSVAVDPSDPDIVFAGTLGGGMFKSINGGTNWSKVTSVNSSSVYKIVYDPHDSATIYAATMNGVFRSRDNGLSWNSINVDLVDLSVNDVMPDPVNANVIYSVAGHGAVQKLEKGAELMVTPGALAFPDVEVGSSSTMDLTLNSTGAAGLSVTNIQIIGSQFTVDLNGGASPCVAVPKTLASGSSCTVSVTFAPSSSGSKTASLRISSDDPLTPNLDVALSGTATPPPMPYMWVEPNVPQNFGQVMEGTDSSPVTFTISNYGNADLVIFSMLIEGTNHTEFSLDVTGGGNGCDVSNPTIGPYSGCTVTVTFSPLNTGLKSAYLTINSNDPLSPFYFSLSGEGTPIPVPGISLSTADIAFGDVTEGDSSTPEEVVINSNGTDDLTVSNIQINGTDASAFVLDLNGGSNPCGTILPVVLAQGSSCTVTVAFSPSNIGLKSASLDIDSDDPDTPTASVALSGTGQPLVINTPPSSPQLVSPSDGSTVSGPAVSLEWNSSSDVDGDDVTYDLYVCEGDIYFSPPCDNPVNDLPIASASANGAVYLAGGSGVGIMFFGFVFTGGIGRKRRLAILLAVLVMAGAILVSCGGGGSDSPAIQGGDTTYTLSGMAGGTYYWKVMATDGKDRTPSAVWRFKTQ